MLKVTALSVEIGGARLLEDVSFEVQSNEVLCIVGQSGAGKSTLLKALQGLMPAQCEHFSFQPPDHAGLHQLGQGALGLPQTRWVMQDPRAALNPCHTLGRAITESLHRQAASARDKRQAVFAALQDVELGPEFYNRLPRQVSLGQAQRACIARALVAHPHLVIYDEPLSALDALVQKKVARRMDVLRRTSGAASLIVTHDLGFAQAYADRILVLHQGRVAAYQSRDAFFETPASAYAASLVEAARSLGRLEAAA